MAVISRTVVSVLSFSQVAIGANASAVPFYGTYERSNNYHGSMLEGQLWAFTDPIRRIQALTSASKRIDRLNFAGAKTDGSQSQEFPRGGDVVTPVEIEFAAYELALVLLQGVDPETEADNLSMTLQGYGNLRSEHDRAIIPAYIRAGIPSQMAWNYLLPYLQERRVLFLERTS